MKKISLITLAILLTINLISGGFENSINKLLQNKDLKNSSISIYGKNLSTGETILNYNSEISVTPASIIKTITSATALELFGDSLQFKTEVAYKGDIDINGVLEGDIYILGYGDPALNSAYFEDHYNKPTELIESWVNSIKKIGITKVKGRVYAVPVKLGTYELPDKWLWEDVANYYGAAASGLNYMDNEYRVHFRTGNHDGAKTEIIKIKPDDVDLKINNKVLSSSTGGDNAYIYYTQGEYDKVIKGTIPWKRSDFSIRGALPNPEMYIAKKLSRELKNSGIPVTKESLVLENIDTSEMNILHTSLSPHLIDIIDIVNKRSFNLYAETLAKHIEEHMEEDFNTAVIKFWEDKSINTGGLFLTDGSGLSPANGATAKVFVDILQYMKENSNYYKPFYNSLAVPGETGTLARTFTHSTLRNNLVAKSGSMTRVISYTGYLNNKNNETIAFCLIFNNYSIPNSRMRIIIEAFLREIV